MNAELGRGESPNVGTRAVVFILGGILVVLVVVAFGFQAIFRDRIGQTYTTYHFFPAPAVTPNERVERLILETRQKKDLNGAHGRMPIDVAMKAIVAKGNHTFDPVGGEP